MTAFTSSQAGAWATSATWGGAGVPTDGDTVTIGHAVSLAASATIGTGSGTAAVIENAGTLTGAAAAVLTVKGAVLASGSMTFGAEGGLSFNTSADAELRLGPGNTNACMTLNGTAASPCVLEAVGAGVVYVTSGGVSGGGRMVATRTNFTRVGSSSTSAIEYWHIDFAGGAFSWNFCNFDQCGLVRVDTNARKNPGQTSANGSTEFRNCKWTNSEATTCFETYGLTGGVTGVLERCDFDAAVNIRNPWGWSLRDCVFRTGPTYPDGDNEYIYGKWTEFTRNFVLNHANGSYWAFGLNATDCFFIIDGGDANNPHLTVCQGGDGNATITGCIHWWALSAANAEGDGFQTRYANTGDPGDNVFTLDRNIILPNASGPDAENNLTWTLFSRNYSGVGSRHQWRIKRCTAFVGGIQAANYSGINVGENAPTVAGESLGVTSTLFVGDSRSYGMKMVDEGDTAEDTFLASDVDYNASYRCQAGSAAEGSGKGYDAFLFSGSDIIGAHDVDDVDPGFVDWTRTPASWAGTLTATMDRLSPGTDYCVQDLLDWIREGFRPTNPLLRGAGAPVDGSPDVGAVAMSDATPQGIGGGGAMGGYSVSPFDSDLRFVATDMGPIYRSEDVGVTWTGLDQAQVTFDMNLDLGCPIGFGSDGDTVFHAPAGRDPVRSLDRGATWRSINMGLAATERIRYWCPNTALSNTILAATNLRLLKSSDNGTTWTSLGISGAARGTLWDYTGDDLYHATPAGVWKSHSGGAFALTYVPATLPLHAFTGGRDVNGLTLAYVDGDGANALAWYEAIADATTFDNAVATSGYVWIKPAGSSEFAKVAHSDGHVTTYLPGAGDIRLAHQTVYDNDVDSYNPGCLWMAENDSQTILVTGNLYWACANLAWGNMVWRSTNGGTSFTRAFLLVDYDDSYAVWPSNLFEYSAVGLDIGWWDTEWQTFAMCQTNSDISGGADYFFLITTEDGGTHWLSPFTKYEDTAPRVAAQRWSSTGLENTVVNRMKWHPTETTLLYAGMSDLGGVVSEDGGRTLRLLDRQYNTVYDFAFVADSDVVYAAMSSRHCWPNDASRNPNLGEGGIFRSDDRGRTWTRLTPATPTASQDPDAFNRSWLSVAVFGTTIYAGSHGRGVAVSTDSGANWAWYNGGIPAYNARIIGQLEVDAAGNAYALLSGDSNTSVTNQADTGIYFLDVENEATDWALLRGTLTLPEGEESDYWRYPTKFAIDPTDADILWLVDQDAGVDVWLTGGVWKSTDRGTTWARVLQMTFPSDVKIDPDAHGTVYAVGNWAQDGSWGNGGIYVTTNGGTAWTKNTRVPYLPIAQAVELDPNDAGRIWYAFFGAGLLHQTRPELLDIDQPGVPTALSATASSTTVDVSWTAPASTAPITGYVVYRDVDNFAGFLTDTSFTDIGLSPSTEYNYQVRALTDRGDYGVPTAYYNVTTDASGNVVIGRAGGRAGRRLVVP